MLGCFDDFNSSTVIGSFVSETAKVLTYKTNKDIKEQCVCSVFYSVTQVIDI